MHLPAVNADMRKWRLFAVPPRSKSMAWDTGYLHMSQKNEFHGGIAIGGTKHCVDTGYLHMSHLKNFRAKLMLAQPGYLWLFQYI